MMEKLQPKLRFPEFNIPWKNSSIRDLTTLVTKGTTPKKFSKNGVNYIKIECLDGSKIDSNKCLFIDEDIHTKELKRSILKENDILFAIAGATIGKCVIVNSQVLPANTNQALSIIRLKSIENIDFVYQILTSEKMRKYILDNISVGAQPNLNLEQINAFSFNTPSLPEQQKIASFLTTVDDKISNLKQKVSLLEKYKKGVMQQIFSQQIRFKDEKGNDYPEWEEKSLGEVVIFLKGKGLPKNEIKENGKFKCIHYGELFTKYNELISQVMSFTNTDEGIVLSQKNDVLMPTSDVTPNGLATASCLREDNVILGGDILVIRQKKLVFDGQFFSYYVKQHRDKVMKLVSGSTVYHLYGSDMAKFKICLPKLEEQHKIVFFLTNIDKKIETTKAQLSKMEVWKKGLLQGMFC